MMVRGGNVDIRVLILFSHCFLPVSEGILVSMPAMSSSWGLESPRGMTYLPTGTQASSQTLTFSMESSKNIPVLVCGSSTRKRISSHHSFASITSTSTSTSFPSNAAAHHSQSPLQLWLQDQLFKVPMFKPLVMQARAVQGLQATPDETGTLNPVISSAGSGKDATKPKSQKGKASGRKSCVVQPADKHLWDMFMVRGLIRIYLR